MIKGIVAIVGRPNVGKSTLFNCLTRSRAAIVDDMPGVTRDRIYGTVESDTDEDGGFFVVDTGGYETKDQMYQPFSSNIVWRQTEAAIEEANAVLMLFDGKEGSLHVHDEELVRFLQKKGKRVVYAVNKIDNEQQQSSMLDFYNLGVENILAISAAHKVGIIELKEEIEKQLASVPELSSRRVESGDALRIAIIGRPNVGKSSILNRLVGQERSLVSDIAGTTRDTIDTSITYNKKPYVIIDTAGIRRRARVSEKLESVCVLKSLQAMEQADIVLLVIDASEPLGDQDTRLASLVTSQYKPLIIVVNKWDLVPEKQSNTSHDFETFIRDRIKGISYVPILFVSCLENQRVSKIMAEIEGVAERYQKRVNTAEVNELLQKVLHEHTPALTKTRTKRIKFFYATQVRTAPPCIVIMCNYPDDLQESYKRFIANRFREDLGFKDIPIKIVFKNKSE